MTAPNYKLFTSRLDSISSPERCLVTLFDLPYAGEMLSVSPAGSSLIPFLSGVGLSLDNVFYLTLSDPDEVWRELYLLDGCLLCVERIYGERLDDESLHVVRNGGNFYLLYARVTFDGGWIFSTPVSDEEVFVDHWPSWVDGYGELVGRVRAVIHEIKLPGR